jgi:hypothetical protein
MITGSGTMGLPVGGLTASTEVVVPTSSGFGLPDSPVVLSALPPGQLFQDFNQRPVNTTVDQDVTVGE